MTYFDLHIADFRTEDGSVDLFERIAAAAEAAERAGFDAVSVMDHLHQIPPYMARTDPIPEAYVLLGALAARTSRIQLGTLVTAVTYRNPALLAKMVTTLDLVSGGRAFVGIGASWHEDEYRAYGFGEALLPIRERLDRLEEALEVCKAMLAGRRRRLPRPVLPARGRTQRTAARAAGWGRPRRRSRRAASASARRLHAASRSLRRPRDRAPQLSVLARHCEEPAAIRPRS